MAKVKITNRAIWDAAYGFNMLDAMKLYLPLRVSMGLKKIRVALRPHIDVLNDIRQEISNRVAPKSVEEKDDEGNVVKPGGTILPFQNGSPEAQEFNKEWQKIAVDTVEVDYEVVKLPLKIPSTCDKCHHNMDKPLLLDSGTLLLLDQFVEVADGE